MTDKKESAKELVEAEETIDEFEEPSAGAVVDEALEENTQQRRWWVILTIVIVSLVAGIGAVGYLGWLQLETLRADLAKVQSATDTQVASLAAGQETSSKSLMEDVDSRMANVDARLQDFSHTVDSLSTLVVEATQSDKDGLVIAEVDYLLQLANHRIGLEHNRPGALLAISRAQSRLGSLGTGAYQPILDQIAVDKAALEGVVVADIGAIVGTLAALLDRVDSLGTGAEKIAPQGESPSAEERDASGWDAFVSAVGENLSQFVEIEQVDGAAAPTLIPDQEYFARENVRISLQNARASAARRDTQNFRLALAEAGRWLNGHFGLSAETPYMRGELERLGAVELAPEFPDLNVSLGLIRKLSRSTPVASDVGTTTVAETVEETMTAVEMVDEVLEAAGEVVEEGADTIEEATQ